MPPIEWEKDQEDPELEPPFAEEIRKEAREIANRYREAVRKSDERRKRATD